MNRIINKTLSNTAWAEITETEGLTIQAMAIQCRTGVDLLFGYGHTAPTTNYWTIKAGTVKSVAWETQHKPRMWVKTGSPTVVVEIEVATLP